MSFRAEDPFISFCHKLVILAPILKKVPPISWGIRTLIDSTQELIGMGLKSSFRIKNMHVLEYNMLYYYIFEVYTFHSKNFGPIVL